MGIIGWLFGRDTKSASQAAAEPAAQKKSLSPEEDALQRDIAIRIEEIEKRLAGIGADSQICGRYAGENGYHVRCNRCKVDVFYRRVQRSIKKPRVVLGHVIDGFEDDELPKKIEGTDREGVCYICDYAELMAWIVERELQCQPDEVMKTRVAELRRIRLERQTQHDAALRVIDAEIEAIHGKLEASKQAKLRDGGATLGSVAVI